MSKFSKALEQAQRDRALRLQPLPTPAPSPPPAPASASSPAPASPPRSAAAPEAAPIGSPPRRRPSLPRRPATLGDEVDSHLVSLVSPAGLVAEQYRALRHVVEQKHKADNLSVIAVSSPGVGDGKTTTAINLAGALAQGADATVLLVEADLRRPSIGRLLGFHGASGVGLVDAILDPKITLADIVQIRPPFNLSVVLGGQIPPSPYEVLKSPRLGALLDEARGRYEYIVLDTPPLVPVQDCRVVARWVDGVVLVVAADRTPRALLEASLEVLDPTKVVGLVFNGYDHLLSGRYADHYAGYYAPEAGTHQRTGALGRVTNTVGSLLRRGESSVARNRRARDRSR
ncbi:MAG TPA: CpsD/CapB family tyrosine-protein kinase [Candidatus Dormibacteraeota bacterium]|jgi:protein-tyrosine kinase|nr:CpsD/CapB family tyrosine-protein kinase [Candidatus Dormibacteraeota bacterium]